MHFCLSLAPLLSSRFFDTYWEIDNDLEPFTTYEYRVRGWNSFGRGSSNVTTVTTTEDKPWGVAPPRWSRLGERDDIIQLQWQAPARSNGLYMCMDITTLGCYNHDSVIKSLSLCLEFSLSN